MRKQITKKPVVSNQERQNIKSQTMPKQKITGRKRITCAVISMVLCFSFTGCGELEKLTSILKNQTQISMTGQKSSAAEDREFLTDGGVVYEEAASCETAGYASAVSFAVENNLNSVMYASNEVYDENPIPDWNTEEYSYQPENPWMSVKTSPFSTFAADVDTASYANLRRMILRGETIPTDAVRIEEMMNYFSYDYPEPKENEPFSVTTEVVSCPWNEDTKLLLIGLQAKKLEQKERPASNLVFLIDVSGSMAEYDKLPLVQRSIHLLTENLGADDRISIVTYADGDEVVLEGVSGDRQSEISKAMEDLMAQGGTNGSAGIQTAYEIAEKNFIPNGNNRIILATDGDLNIGITDEGSLTRLIKEKAKSGVFLSVLGFGTKNISDTNMEALADHGNGNYSYIDSVSEARKVLIEEMGATLFTVAKDVKLQVEFNPALVKGYRLIGYENRTMSAEEFADDTKDGGEIGAGHQVSALYEIAKTDSAQEIPEVISRYGNAGNMEDLAPASGDTEIPELLTVNVRYKEPETEKSTLLTYPVPAALETSQMSENLSWAAGVAQVGMLLKDSEYSGNTSLEEVRTRLGRLNMLRDDDYRQEFLYLLSVITRTAGA